MTVSVEEHLAAWAKQATSCEVTLAEWGFVADMRKAFRAGVGFGWMQSIVEVEWNAKHGPHAWGPRYFEREIAKLRTECDRLRAELQEVCRHPVSIDSMPAFCGVCGKELE